jgi:hypothetical protein
MREHTFQYLLTMLHCISVAKGHLNTYILRLGRLLSGANLRKLIVIVSMGKGDKYAERLFH